MKPSGFVPVPSREKCRGGNHTQINTLMKRHIRKAIAVTFAVAWCVVFPTSLFSVGYLNLSLGDALAVLAAPCGLTAVLGLLNDHL